MTRTSLAFLFLILGGSVAAAQQAPSTSEFVKKAEIGGQLEVEAGHVAAEKGRTPAVKQFGERMVKDHTRLNEKFASVLAKDPDSSLPKQSPLDSEAQQSLDKLKSVSPLEFDKTYVDMMVEDHKKDIAEFEDYAKHGEDKLIRQAARLALPVLKHHLAMAEKIAHSQNRSSERW